MSFTGSSHFDFSKITQTSKMARKRFTVSQQLAFVKCWDEEREKGKGLRAFARELGVDPTQLRRWKSMVTTIEERMTNNGGRGRTLSATAASLHPGRKSCLHDIEDALLDFIFSNRDQGLAVSVRMVVMKASQLDSSFHRKSAKAKDQAVRRFVASHGLVHRIHTHQSQEDNGGGLDGADASKVDW